MNWISFAMLLGGFVLGLVTGFVLRLIHSKSAKELAAELFKESEVQRQKNVDTVIQSVKESFGNLSLSALSRSTEEFLKLARAKLESEREISAKELQEKKGLIDQQLQRMTTELENVSNLMQSLEKDRIEKFGELASQLKATGEQTSALAQTTNALRQALASTKARGQWGERMAEDVLRIAGFVENVNYLKQRVIAESGSRPDFTFLLPRGLVLHMDVKFPLDNYLHYLEVESPAEKSKFRNDFIRDVRSRIKEVTSREYINPEKNTVDYVLLFIPNEQIYAFIHEQDSSLLDMGIKERVVLCSPVTLFAVLAVIRQAVENFSLEKTSNQILALLGAFKKQWLEFTKKMEAVGKHISDAQREYESLITTRRRQLEKPLNDIDALRVERGIAIGLGMEGPSLPSNEATLNLEKADSQQNEKSLDDIDSLNKIL